MSTFSACIAIQATAQAQEPPPRDEFGVDLGAAIPICDGPCAPHFGPAADWDLLFRVSHVFKIGLSQSIARFSYLDTGTLQRSQAESMVLGFLVRLYPVMGRRAGLYFDLWPGFYVSGMGDAASVGLAMGARAGVPIVISRRFRIGPYLLGAIHGYATGGGCPYADLYANGTGACPAAEPAHRGFFSFGLQTTFLFGPPE